MDSDRSNPVSYHLSGGLSREQIDLIYRNALRTLAEVGVVVDKRLIDLIKGRGGVRCDGRTVRLTAELVESCVEANRAKPPPPQPKNWIATAPNALPFHVVDWQTDDLPSLSDGHPERCGRRVHHKYADFGDHCAGDHSRRIRSGRRRSFGRIHHCQPDRTCGFALGTRL